jgi:hypothetical protein
LEESAIAKLHDVAFMKGYERVALPLGGIKIIDFTSVLYGQTASPK